LGSRPVLDSAAISPRRRLPVSGWTLARYGVAPLSVGICLLLGLGFYQEFKPIPFMPFVPAVAVCAGFAGLGPALLALGLSGAGAVYLSALPDRPDSPGAQLAFFLAAAAVVTVLSTLLRRVYDQLETAQRDAQLARDAEARAHCMLTEMTGAYAREQKLRVKAEGDLAAALARCAECPFPEPILAEELTSRELDVLRLVADGLTNAEAAQRLIISPYTVNMHLRSIYAKLGVSSRSAAVRRALDHKLI